MYLLNEPFNSISAWTLSTTGDGASDINPAGQLRLYIGSSGSVDRYRDIGSLPRKFNIEVKTYFDNIEATTYAKLRAYVKDDVRLDVRFSQSGLKIYDGSSWNEVGTDLIKYNGSAEWQTWRFECDFTVIASAICDIYLTDSSHSNEKVGSNVDCSDTLNHALNGTIYLGLYDVSNGCQCHVDYIEITTVDKNVIAFGNNF